VLVCSNIWSLCHSRNGLGEQRYRKSAHKIKYDRHKHMCFCLTRHLPTTTSTLLDERPTSSCYTRSYAPGGCTFKLGVTAAMRCDNASRTLPTIEPKLRPYINTTAKNRP
jgi:hypothetical protein